MPKPKSTITFQIPEHEKEILHQYCEQEQRSQSDVLRELVRSLKRKLRAKETEG
jgi:Arc/MetJ-type ribon-helix-helix transcriptional regulator